MSGDIIVRVEHLWKQYGLPSPLAFLRRRDEKHGPWAIRDVSFNLRQGESLGIIGRNGAGKSTLLKLLAGVSPPTRGSIDIIGRLFPMIEITAGMHMELTGRENVRLLGAIMGLSAREMDSRMPEIEAFCDLEEWFDQPLWMYSSGMLARIGFAVAIHVDADILLVDEVLAVGDLPFQKKCMNQINRLIAEGKSIILVSHSPYMIERICDRAILLDHGGIHTEGLPKEVMQAYFLLTNGKTAEAAAKRELLAPHLRPGTGDIRVTSVEMLDGNHQEIAKARTGEKLILRIRFTAKESVDIPNFAVRILDNQNTLLMSLSSIAERPSKIQPGDGYVDCNIECLPFMSNSLVVQIKVSNYVLLDMVENALSFDIQSNERQALESGHIGIAYSPCSWRFSKSAVFDSPTRSAIA